VCVGDLATCDASLETLGESLATHATTTTAAAKVFCIRRVSRRKLRR